MKYCNICHRYKSFTDFHKQRDSYRFACKQCYTKYNRKYDDKYRIEYKENNKVKILARNAVHMSLRYKKIIKLPCIKCGEINVQGHHYLGYDKSHWLDIQWLCSIHHNKAHQP